MHHTCKTRQIQREGNLILLQRKVHVLHHRHSRQLDRQFRWTRQSVHRKPNTCRFPSRAYLVAISSSVTLTNEYKVTHLGRKSSPLFVGEDLFSVVREHCANTRGCSVFALDLGAGWADVRTYTFSLQPSATRCERQKFPSPKTNGIWQCFSLTEQLNYVSWTYANRLRYTYTKFIGWHEQVSISHKLNMDIIADMRRCWRWTH